MRDAWVELLWMLFWLAWAGIGLLCSWPAWIVFVFFLLSGFIWIDGDLF